MHGGSSKATYVHPVEHYEFWRGKLAGTEPPWGAFGENFTVEGLREETSRIGDRFRIGTTEVILTEPGLPCLKLAVKISRDEIIKLFLRSRRAGFYCAGEQGREVGGGISIESLGRDDNAVTNLELVEIYLHKTKDKRAMERALKTKALLQSWRDYFQEQTRAMPEKQ